MAPRAVSLRIMTSPVDAAPPKGILGSRAVAHHAGAIARVMVFAGDRERGGGAARSHGRLAAASADRTASDAGRAERGIANRLFLGGPVCDTASPALSADRDRVAWHWSAGSAGAVPARLG